MFVVVWMFGIVPIFGGVVDSGEVLVRNEAELRAFMLFNGGVDAESGGDIELAIGRYEAALGLKSDLLEAMNNLGGLQRKLGNLKEAERYFEMLFEGSRSRKQELEAAALNNLGLVQFTKATRDDIAINPELIRIKAIPRYLQALEIKQNFSDAIFNLGNAFQALGEYQLAFEAYQRLLSIEPNHTKGNMNLGNLFFGLNLFEEATRMFQVAFQNSGPEDLASLANSLGQVLRESGDLAGALEHHEFAKEIEPDAFSPRLQEILVRRKLCLWETWERLHRDLLKVSEKISQDAPKWDRIPPFDSLLFPSVFWEGRVTPVQIAVESMRGFEMRPFPEKTRQDRQLRIAYLSFDMNGKHPMSFLMRGLYRHHNRDVVNVTLFMYGPFEDEEMLVDTFFDVRNVASDEIARKISASNADVVIDLMGHTRGARLDIVGLKPAPVYVNYLGYPGTSGFKDGFLFADVVVAPAESIWSKKVFSETVVHIPVTFQANNYPRIRKDTKRTHDGVFRFANFNTVHKLDPLSFGSWMSILQDVPGSVLVLLESKDAIGNLRAEAWKHGIDPNRLVFLPKVSRQEHLDRIGSSADLFLDSFVYGAHSTASDVLWAGLPLLTSLHGRTFHSRVASSLLTSLGLETALVAEDKEEFVSLAKLFAMKPTLLAAIQKELQKRVETTRTFDPRVKARHIELALQTTWDLRKRMDVVRIVERKADLSEGAILIAQQRHFEALEVFKETIMEERRPRSRIVFFCNEFGQTWWPHWGPNSPENEGIGGSEEAVIFLSRELVKLGFDVEIFAEPRKEDQGRDQFGVWWFHHEKFDKNDSPFVFVAWRYHISLPLGRKAKHRILWLHDIVTQLGEQIAILHEQGFVDKVFGGSEFHIRQMHGFPRAVLGYGLDSEFFEDGVNDANELIYASAPNRGLETLLEMWTAIRKAIPNARLRIYYGFSPKFVAWGQKSIKNFDEWMRSMLKTIEDTEGVFLEGMVSHVQLAKAYARAGFSLYPTSFPETGCVSIMKAMAMGAIPITSRFLNSSLPELTKLFDLGPEPPSSDQEYLDRTIEVLRNANSKEILERRMSMKSWARKHLLWKQKAREFIEKLT